MKQSTYDPIWRELLATTDEPLGVQDLVERTGASKARAHVWIRDNEPSLVKVGTNARGGRTYVWRTNPIARRLQHDEPRAEEGRVSEERVTRDAPQPGLHVGARLVVSQLSVNQGQVVIELVDEAGMMHEATLRL